MSCKEHLGRTAGAGALGRASSSPLGLLNLPECQTAWKISSFSQFLLFSQEQPPQDSEKAEQSTGYSPATLLRFIASRCFCAHGSHWSQKGGGKVKAEAKFPPPPHNGVQGRDGGAFWMTRGFCESPEKPKGWAWCRSSWINPLPPQAAPRSPSITAKGKAGIPTPDLSQMLYL